MYFWKANRMARHKSTDGLHKKKNGVYERQEVIHGKRRSFSSKDPDEVWRKRNEAISIAECDTEHDAGPLFEVVSDAYKARVENMKYGTQKTYLPAINRAREYFKGKKMREIEPYMIAVFLQSMTNMAQTTVSNQKTILNSIFQEWIDSPIWRGDCNPAKLTSIPKGLKKGRRLPPTEDQIKIVKDHYKDSDALPAVIYLCTGERRGEACGIRLRDIDFINKTISITKAIEFRNNRPYITGTKTDAGVRTIPLLDMLAEALEPIKGSSPDIYILSNSNEPLKYSEYDKRWTAFWKKYGFAHEVKEKQKKSRHGKEFVYDVSRWRADVVAHQFRHEYVCMLCMADVSEEVAIQLVGHANAKMIHAVYLTLKPQMIANAGNRLNLLLKSNADQMQTK